MPIHRAVTALTLLLALGPAALSRGQDADLPDTLAWVGLADSRVVDWLGNGYRLDMVCGTNDAACRDSLMRPLRYEIPVHDAPGGPVLGSLVVVAEPDEPLRLFFVDGPTEREFTPDLYLEDWGYGPPWFHLTILERASVWFRVPVPGPGRGWLRADDLAADGRPSVERVEPGETVYVTPRGDAVVLGFGNGTLVVRAEQEADMWCSPDDLPPLRPWTEIRIPFDELFDERGRLMLMPKYPKGC